MHPLAFARVMHTARLVHERSMCMQGMEQNVFMARLGPGAVLKVLGKHISCNWFLDCGIPEHEEVAVHLVREAQSEDLQNWFNLKLSGVSALRLLLLSAHARYLPSLSLQGAARLFQKMRQCWDS